MDIAATGLALPLLSPLRDRSQARPDTSQQAAERNNRDNTGTLSTRGDGRNERVVPGEVIYARPAQPRGIEGGIEAAQRGLADATAGFTASGNRRFSLQAAVQTFRDNEALIPGPGEQRQVSGIIDEYV